MPKISIISPHLFLLSLVVFCLVISPVSASTLYAWPSQSCSNVGYSGYGISMPPGSYDYSLSGGEEWDCFTPICINWYGPCLSGNNETTPTPTPTPSENCVSACGYTWTAGFTADDILLQMCVYSAGTTPLSSCDVCGWQMALMQQQFPCAVPPSPVPTYSPTPLPTVPPPPTTLPTLPPGPSPGPQAITVGEKDVHDVNFQVPTIATIAMPAWNKSTERDNITSVIGNITDPYFNTVDGFSVLISLIIQHLLYLPNWVMASIYSTVQPIAKAFADIIVIVVDWGSVPLQLMRLALDNTPFGIQALLIYGVCLEMIIYLLRGET